MARTEHPFFVGGALHGHKVPPTLWNKDFIVVAATQQHTLVYFQSRWVVSGGDLIPMFVKHDMPLEDYTPIVEHMLKDRRPRPPTQVTRPKDGNF